MATKFSTSFHLSKGLVIECKGLVIEVYEAFTGATQAAVNEVVAKIEAAAAAQKSAAKESAAKDTL